MSVDRSLYYQTLTPGRGGSASPSDPFGDVARREAQRGEPLATFTRVELDAIADVIRYGRRGPGLRSALLKIAAHIRDDFRAELGAALRGKAVRHG